MFTKRHYQVIASAIHASKVRADQPDLVEMLIELFKADNPRFREDIFRDKSGQFKIEFN